MSAVTPDYDGLFEAAVQARREEVYSRQAWLAADLILQDMTLSPAERRSLYGPERMHVQTFPLPTPRWTLS